MGIVTDVWYCDEIKFKALGFDERVEWDAWLVSYRVIGEEDFYVGGMSDEVLN